MPPLASEEFPDPAPSGAGTAAPPVLAQIVRSDFVEGHHRGSLVLLAADGSVERALGDVASPIFPRSTSKPTQAVAMLRAGLELRGERLALAAGSHSGELFHQETVRTMLTDHGLTEADLRCPPDLPLDREEADAQLAAGGGRTRLAMNCSGKHAAMLATCRAAGWPVESYLSPSHPLQRLIAETLAELSGEPVAHVGIDGCGAPLMAVSLAALARSFQALLRATPGSPAGRVAEAMTAHPEYVAGTRRDDTAVMRDVPGAIAKMGAEAVQAVALPDGRALAFKIDDGSIRAVGPVLARALTGMGVTAPVVSRLADSPLLGGGEPVGEVRAVF